MKIDFEQLKRAFNVSHLKAEIAFHRDIGFTSNNYIYLAAKEYLDLQPVKESLTTDYAADTSQNIEHTGD